MFPNFFLDNKIKALSLFTILLMSLFYCSYFPMVKAEPSITEDDFYEYLSLFEIDIYQWNNTQWQYRETRDFKYKTNWYAKLFINHTNLKRTQLSLVYTPLGKKYYNASMIYGYYVYVGLEESNNMLEGFDDLIIGLGANEVSTNASAKQYFIDTIFGFGAYRKDVKYNNTSIWNYTGTDVGQPPWAGETGLPYFLNSTIYGNTDDLPIGSEPVESYDVDYSYNIADEISKRLRIDFYGYWNEEWVSVYRYVRLDYTASTKWFVKNFYNTSYTTAEMTVEKWIIGVENIWWSPEIYQYDNFADLLIVAVKLSIDTTVIYRLDMVQQTGGIAMCLYWEYGAFDSGNWVCVFNGTEKYQQPPNWNPWAYGIILEILNPFSFSDATIQTLNSSNSTLGDCYSVVKKNTYRGVTTYTNFFSVTYVWQKTIPALTCFRTILSVKIPSNASLGNIFDGSPSNYLRVWIEIKKSGVTILSDNRLLTINLDGTSTQQYWYFDDLTPTNLLASGTYEFRLTFKGWSGSGGYLRFGIDLVMANWVEYGEPMTIEKFGYRADYEGIPLQNQLCVSAIGPGATNVTGFKLFDYDSIASLKATPNTEKYFWFWIINNTRQNVKYYSPLATLNLLINYDYNVTAYFGNVSYSFVSEESLGLTMKADLNMDVIIDYLDIGFTALLYGKESDDPDWETSLADAIDKLLYQDGIIDYFDLNILASRFGEEYEG